MEIKKSKEKEIKTLGRNDRLKNEYFVSASKNDKQNNKKPQSRPLKMNQMRFSVILKKG